MIDNTHQINQHQLEELRHLESLCKKIDGSAPNIYPHILTQYRTFPASLFYYDANQLIGFLSAYFFYEDAVEVSVMVHPSARKRGIGRKLLHAILPLIQTQNYPALIFSTPANLNNQWLLNNGLTYLHSEYNMERENLNPILANSKNLAFRTATIDDIYELCRIDEQCFPEKNGNLKERFEHLLNERRYQIIQVFQNNHLIGKAHLRWDIEAATLSDIAIIPHEQGKGLGTALITYCINLALSEGQAHLNLDVETHNERALNLYTRLGFLIKNACDYWSIEIKQLLK